MKYMNKMNGSSGTNYITRFYDAKDTADTDFMTMAEDEVFASSIPSEKLFFIESYERDTGDWSLTRRESLTPPER